MPLSANAEDSLTVNDSPEERHKQEETEGIEVVQ
jgi:hypothetical protein